MNTSSKTKHQKSLGKRIGRYWFYLLIVWAVCVLQMFSVLSIPELSIQDKLYQQIDNLSSDIYVIGIDDETLSQYGTFSNWSRTGIADLIDKLCEDEYYKPAVIALDINYFDYSDEKKDQRLIEAVKNAGNVILTEQFKTAYNQAGGYQIVGYDTSIKELQDVAYDGGFVNVTYDEDTIVRHAIDSISYNDKIYDSFDVAIYKAYLASKGLSDNNVFNKGSFYISYSGNIGDYYGTSGKACSVVNVMNGKYSTHAFRNAIVIVGAYTYGLQDNFYVPHVSNEQMFGAEIHANIVNQLINQSYKTELDNATCVAIVNVMTIIAILICLRFGMRISIPSCIAMCVLYVIGAYYICAEFGVLLPILVPVLGVLVVMIANIIDSYSQTQRNQHKMVEKYSKYLSPEIAKEIAKSGDDELLLGGINKDIAVLFVDIRSFTSLSESLQPDQVFAILNRYLEVTTQAIFDYGGSIDKYIGDATMALFNAPLDLEDYDFKAVCAGLKMVERSSEFNESLDPSLQGKVGFGVGIQSGICAIGNVGTKNRMEYTAIGDTVNTASRLEGIAKAGEVIISEDVYQRVKDRVECIDYGLHDLKGKARKMQCYKAIRIISDK